MTALLANSLPTNLGAETFDGVLGIIMTQAHIVAGCTWLGGLASLVLLSRTPAVSQSSSPRHTGGSYSSSCS